jgi:hypothetical protein
MLATVGGLLRELKPFEEDHSFDEVTFDLEDKGIFRIYHVEMDEDDRLCLYVDQTAHEEDGCYAEEDYDLRPDYYTVGTLIDELESYDEDTEVYLAGEGLYMNIDSAEGGRDYLYEYDDEYEELIFDVSAFGQYEKETADVSANRARAREESEKAERKQARESALETIALIVILILVSGLLTYNLMAIFRHDGNSIVGNVIWSVMCVVLLVINSAVLYYSTDK